MIEVEVIAFLSFRRSCGLSRTLAGIRVEAIAVAVALVVVVVVVVIAVIAVGVEVAVVGSCINSIEYGSVAIMVQGSGFRAQSCRLP